MIEDAERRDLDAFSEIVEDAMDYPSWRDLVTRACEQPAVRKQFMAETGCALPAPADSMETVGAGSTFDEQSRLFTLWVTKRHYGGRRRRGAAIPPEVWEAVSCSDRD